MKPELPDNRVIVPLSGNVTGDKCYDLIKSLSPYVWGFKLHPSTIIRIMRNDHTDVLQLCEDAGARAFIDLKGFDIPSEVANMIRDFEAACSVVDIITVHQNGGDAMVRAAVQAAKQAMIFPVTILTSMAAEEAFAVYAAQRLKIDPSMMSFYRDDKITHFAARAFACGAAGTISSAVDLALFEDQPELYGNETMLRCTPGIRPADGTVTNDDQDRPVTPAEAARAGSDLIVVGRPILQAKDPVAAAQAIQAEYTAALVV